MVRIEAGAHISALTEPSKEEAAKRNARSMRFTARESGEQLREIGAHIGMGTFTGRLSSSRGLGLADHPSM
jgi:hypothetical protein